MTPEQKKVQRLKHGSLAVVLGALLIISGTFAWTSLTQSAINPMWDETNHGGRIHDNFDGDLENRPAHGSRNKDVYAENFGDTPIFVRIRLLEFFAFDDEPLDEGWNIDDPMGVNGENVAWQPYVSRLHDVNERDFSNLVGIHTGVSWDLGHQDARVKCYMPTFNRATHQVAPGADGTEFPGMFAHVNAFRMTDATGYGVEWLSRAGAGEVVPEQDEITHAIHFREIGTQSAPGLNPAFHRTLDPAGQHDNWACGEELASQRIYTPRISTSSQDRELRAETLGADEDGMFTHAAQPTLTPRFDEDVTYEGTEDLTAFGELVVDVLSLDAIGDFAGVMTLQNWEDLGRPHGDFWIHDPSDSEGWFYWNGWLAPGERSHYGQTNATSLLLDAIYVPQDSRTWQYVIVVDGDFFRPETIDGLNLSAAVMAIFDQVGPDYAQRPNGRPMSPGPNAPTTPGATEPVEPTDPTDSVEPTEPTNPIPGPVLNVMFNHIIDDTEYDVVLTWSTRLNTGEPLPNEYRLYINGDYAATHEPTGAQVHPHTGGRWMEIGHLVQDGDVLTIVPVTNGVNQDEIGPFTFVAQ